MATNQLLVKSGIVVVVVVAFGVCSHTLRIANAWADGLDVWNVTRCNTCATAVYDPGFEIMKPVHAFLKSHVAVRHACLLADQILLDCVSTGLVIMFASRFATEFASNAKLLSSLALQSSFVLAVRFFSLACVRLPPPEDMLWDMPFGIPSLTVDYGTTKDFFFSGHVALMTVGMLVFIQSSGFRITPAIRCCMVAIWSFNVLVLIATRAHYTVDVIIGFLVAIATNTLFGSAALAREPADSHVKTAQAAVKPSRRGASRSPARK